MHPSNTLFNEWDVVYIVGLAQFCINVFAWGLRLPLAFVLNLRDPVSAVFVPYSNQNGITTTGDKDNLFLVDRYTIFCKDGNGVVVS
jgi:hypothetical protein